MPAPAALPARDAPAPHEPHEPPAPHARELPELARHLGVQVDAGLAADEVASRLSRHGPNRLPEPAPRPLWQRLLEPFRDVMIGVLLAAAVLSG